MVTFKTENLSFSYPNGKAALKNINLEINQGEFVLICGKSGSGKTTLLRMLKPELQPNGIVLGNVELFEKPVAQLSKRETAAQIGFVLQNPDYQIVMDTVRAEIAFGLENLGFDSKTIRLRTAEIASYFSLSKLMDKKTSELSGGQKQLLCLASVMAMYPKAIILDEPTSQLDPAAAENLLRTLQRLCREDGLTIVITEQRLENIIPFADRLIAVDNGELIFNGDVRSIDRKLLEKNEFLKSAMPVPLRIQAALDLGKKPLLTISEGRQALTRLFENKSVEQENLPNFEQKNKETALKMRDVWYAYPNGAYVLKGLNLEVKKGSFFAVMGENACGKTTAMNLMSGILECKRGKIEIFEKNLKKYPKTQLYRNLAAVLPQKCQLLFAGPTIYEDLCSVLCDEKLSKKQLEEKIFKQAEFCKITQILKSHPYDVSGGEIQRAALAMVLLKNPEIIFLDEPTKGMDNLFKKQFGQKMRQLCQAGKTIVMVSHDVEFCAEYCDECALIFDGQLALQKNAKKFFAGNYFYTTAANKMARSIFPSAVTESEVLALCKKNL